MIFFSFIQLVTCSLPDILSDQLSPFPIHPPSSWCLSPIELNSNHLNNFSSLSLKFNPGLALTDLSELLTQVKVFGDSSFSPCSVSLLSEAVNDWQATCFYSVSKAGVYGPVHIRVSRQSGGQTLAEDKTFGYFAVLDEEPKTEEDGLVVEYVHETNKTDVTVSQSKTLSFTFALNESQQLRPGDYLKLRADPNFRFSKNIRVTWKNPNDEVENAANALLLNETQELLIFPFDKGLNLQQENVSYTFQAEGIQAPAAVLNQTFKWVLEFWRFGVTTLVKRVSGAGPVGKMVPGVIQIISWKPVQKAMKNFMFADYTGFMDLSLKTEHPIPPGGSLDLVFFNVLLCTTSFQTDQTQKTSKLSGSGSSETCSLLARSEAGDVLDCFVSDKDFYSIVNCSTKAEVSSIIHIYTLASVLDTEMLINSTMTKDAFSNRVDNISQLFNATFEQASVLEVDSLYIAKAFNDPQGQFVAGSVGSFGIVLTLTAGLNLEAGDTISLSLPVSTASQRTESFIALSSNFYAFYSYGDKIGFNSLTFMSSKLLPSDCLLISPGEVRLVLKNEVKAKQKLVFFIGSGSNDTRSNMSLPLFPTKLDDFSEAVVSLFKGSQSLLYSNPLYWKVNENDLEVSFNPFCNNVRISGLPVEVQVSLEIGLKLEGLKVSFQFSSNLLFSSGLSPGDEYPSNLSGLKLTDSALLVMGTNEISRKNPIKVVLPFPLRASDENLSVQVTKAVGTKDEILFKQSKTLAFFSPEIEYKTLDPISADSDSSKTLDFKLDIGDYDKTASTSVVVRTVYILPVGYSILNSELNLLGFESFDFPFKVALGSQQVSERVSNVFIEQVSTPWFQVQESQAVVFAVSAGADYSNSNCLAAFKQGFNPIQPGSFKLKLFWPRLLSAFTVNKARSELRLRLDYSGMLRPGSVIKFEVGEAWKGLIDKAWVNIGKIRVDGFLDENSVWTSGALDKAFSLPIDLFATVRLPVYHGLDGEAGKDVVGFKSVQVFFKSNNREILSFRWDQARDDLENKAVTFLVPANSQPLVSNAESWAFPDVLGSTGVTFGTGFEIVKEIEAGALIEVKADFLTDRAAFENIWANFDYETVKLVEKAMIFRTSRSLAAGFQVKIVKNFAFELEREGLFDVFIKVEVKGMIFVDDSVGLEGKSPRIKGFKIKPAADVHINSIQVLPSVLNSGFSCWYQFEFSVNAQVAGGIFFHFLAGPGFNSDPGPTFSFDDLPGKNFIEGLLPNGSRLDCRSKHWMVSCYIGKTLSTNKQVLLSLYLKNPLPIGESSIVITNQLGTVMVQPLKLDFLDKSFFPTVSEQIQMFNLTVNTEPDGFRHNLTFSAVINANLSSDSGLFIQVPPPYELAFSEKVLRCRISQNEQIIRHLAACQFDHDLISIDVNSYQLDSSKAISFLIQGLATPQEGFTRPKFLYEKVLKSYYSGSFLLVRSRLETVGKSKIATFQAFSFSNLAPAFVAFQDTGLEKILVNENLKLVVTKGTTAGPFKVRLSGGKIKSKSLSIKGKPRNPQLVLSRNGEMVIQDDGEEAEFWIGVPADAKVGFFYVDWVLNETSFGDSKIYVAPLGTLVEVNEDSKYQIQLPNKVEVLQSLTSLPCEVTLANPLFAPFESIQIELIHYYSDLLIIFDPKFIILTNDSTSKLFTISCLNCSLFEDYQFSAIVSGPSASIFEVSNSGSFVVKEHSTKPAVIQLKLAEVTSNSLSLEFESDNVGLATWCLAGELFSVLSENLSESYILSHVSGYGDTNSTFPSFAEQFASYSQNLSNLLEISETYEDFAFEGLQLGRRIFFSSRIKTAANEKVEISFSKLVPDSIFQFFIIFDNWSGYTSARSLTVKTHPIPSHGQVKLTGSKTKEKISSLLVNLLKIDPKRLSFVNFNRRRLQTYQSFMIVSSITEGKSGFEYISSFTAKQLSEALGTVVNSISEMNAKTINGGQWLEGPKWNLTENSLMINFTSNIEGVVVCQVENSPDLNKTITSQQIFYFKDRDWKDNSKNSVTLDVPANEPYEYHFNFSDYPEDFNQVSCILCNTFPITPNCSNVTSSSFNSQVKDSSSAWVFVGLLSLFV